MQRRQLSILAILVVVALLGFVLHANLRPSGMFRIAAPPVPAAPSSAAGTIRELGRGPSSTLTNISGTTLLEKPRYTGQDALGRNWVLTAETAGQDGSAASATYILQQVQAVWTDPSQTSPFTLSAEEGRYQQTSATLQLTGNVSATGLGFNVVAPVVEADLTSRTLVASGGTRIVGQTGGPKGWDIAIAAPNLTANQNGSHLVLTGGVRARFTPTGN